MSEGEMFMVGPFPALAGIKLASTNRQTTRQSTLSSLEFFLLLGQISISHFETWGIMFLFCLKNNAYFYLNALNQ